MYRRHKYAAAGLWRVSLMPPPSYPLTCAQCPGRHFARKESRQQHYRSAPGHPFCEICDLYLESQGALDIHNSTRHLQFSCNKCKTAFLTQASLEDHYRGKPSVIHPNCHRCGKGFFDRKVLEEHVQAAHPTVRCCGQILYKEDLAVHYKDSARHPSCVLCLVGFEDDAAYDAHGAAEHPEHRCTACRRQFISQCELQNHFKVSPAHPKCERCNVGLFDDEAFLEHEVTVHTATQTFPRLAPPINRLAIEGPPGLPPPGQPTLPLPGPVASEKWQMTQNAVVPFAVPPPSIASTPFVGPAKPAWAESKAPFPSKTWGSETSSGSTERASSSASRVFPVGAVVQNQHLISSANQVPDSQSKAAFDVAGRRGHFQATPYPPRPGSLTKIHENGTWMNRQIPESTAIPNVRSPVDKTISPQSSTSSFLSSSYGELSDASSGVFSGARLFPCISFFTEYFSSTFRQRREPSGVVRKEHLEWDDCRNPCTDWDVCRNPCTDLTLHDVQPHPTHPAHSRDMRSYFLQRLHYKEGRSSPCMPEVRQDSAHSRNFPIASRRLNRSVAALASLIAVPAGGPPYIISE
ncbi:hypothetical protein B0H11DRAFT_485258 [Mycena galericulata]|nr:hypothetical protein B0H11DRAFT_485258 [Mycena galericulata]